MKSVHIRSFSDPYFTAFRRNMEWSEYLSVCSPNAGKYGPEKLQGQSSYFISHKTIFYPRTYSKKLNNVEQENLVFSLQLLNTYIKIGTIQRRLAWPLRKDDTQIREAFQIFTHINLDSHINLDFVVKGC